MPSNDGGVFVPSTHKGNSRKVYHTMGDCSQINDTESVKEKPLSVVEDKMGLRECNECSGENYRDSSGCTPKYDLEALEPRDVGLSPLGQGGAD